MGEHEQGCLFCRFASAPGEREHFILERGTRWFVVINRFPYTTGHVMVVCNRHVDRISDFDGDEAAELVHLMARCERAIGRAYSPDGVNVGANLGRSAGAGIEGHFHMHLVPRWHGDTNFMSSVGETRVVSEDLNDTYERLLKALRED
ncbi:MAG TPA: HIT domain-containing protein [Candidatus Krumholzibacteria bacterium]|nr:HIT domain-containing protein [Candidatus Krumholzibacteria bacterium]